MKNQRHHARDHVGLTLTLVGLMSVTTLVLGPARLVSAQAVAPGWSYTSNLNTARHFHTATLLPNGKVLVAGGVGLLGSFLNSAELYDPATGMWSSTGNLNAVRNSHTATLLPNGNVLVAGGSNRFVSHGSAELYDPATGTWNSTGNLNAVRNGHTATLLPNGKVLVAGGGDPNGLNSAELYDPATGTWSTTGNLNTARRGHTATLLQNGKVLIAGGEGFNSAELYDPVTGAWSVTGNLNTGREFHTETLLPNGKVLVTRGNSAELYDSSTGTWSITGNLNKGAAYTATLLQNGKVLVAGSGVNDDDSDFNASELYDPATGTWSITADPNEFRVGHTATLLPNCKVLIAGGFRFDALNSAELYDPGTSSTPNPIDDAQFFVRQHYLDFLNRPADDLGLAFWTNEITLCGPDAQCIDIKRTNVSAAFVLSIEFQETGYLVHRMYKAAYGDTTSPNVAVPVPIIRLNEFLPDAQRIGQGVQVGIGDWQTQLENNKVAYAREFVARQRFLSAYPLTMSPAQFVDKLNQNAGGVLSQSERDLLVAELTAATDVTQGRASVMRKVAEDADLRQGESNRAFVLMQYYGYLRRNPDDPPDTDFRGWEFWRNKLNQFNGNFVQAEMVKAFIVSIEYRQRFGQPQSQPSIKRGASKLSVVSCP